MKTSIFKYEHANRAPKTLILNVLWFVIGPLCDLFVDVCFLICSGFNILSIIFSFFILRHRTMDKVHKYNSFNKCLCCVSTYLLIGRLSSLASALCFLCIITS
jgi:hypothetical protein